jgi:hypothetical protein
MHPRIHAFLAMLFSYGLFTIGVPGFFCLGIALLGNTKLIPSFIVLISIFLLYYLIIRTLRVHCREITQPFFCKYESGISIVL